ncbi:hypothetical protein ASV53_24895, partial [Photobacterium sanguinicancri]
MPSGPSASSPTTRSRCSRIGPAPSNSSPRCSPTSETGSRYPSRLGGIALRRGAGVLAWKHARSRAHCRRHPFGRPSPPADDLAVPHGDDH